MNTDQTVTQRLRDFLRAHDAPFRELQHDATRTSEASAEARGEDLRLGGKALLIKTDDVFRLFVLPADRRLNSAAVKRELKVRRVRFASPAELAELTGLVPGCVPPFGMPILPFDLYADASLRRNDRIAFNAGSLTTSFILPMDDYLRLASPTVFEFAGPAAG